MMLLPNRPLTVRSSTMCCCEEEEMSLHPRVGCSLVCRCRLKWNRHHRRRHS